MRLFAAVLLLSGCDAFWDLQQYRIANDLESKTHDEDGDNEPDAFDLCPHDSRASVDDADFDGIGDECDPRTSSPDVRYLFTFEGGKLDGLDRVGTASPENDAIVLGELTIETSALVVRDLDQVENVRVVIGATIVDASESQSAEIGAYVRHRAFVDTERGDNCLIGRNGGMPNTTFVELNQDDKDVGDTLVDTNFEGATGFLRFDQSRTLLDCTYTSDKLSGAESMSVTPGTPPLGRVAVRASHMLARLHYVFVVVPKPQ